MSLFRKLRGHLRSRPHGRRDRRRIPVSPGAAQGAPCRAGSVTKGPPRGRAPVRQPHPSARTTRDRNVLPALQAVLQDLRFAMRNMRRNPAFAAAAVLSLALGIGANTALFSVLDGLLLRLLPVEDPRSLVLLRDSTGDRFAYPAYELLRAHSRLLSGVAGIQFLPGTLETWTHGRTLQAACRPFPATISKCSAQTRRAGVPLPRENSMSR